jgi:hypothetical protein
MPRSRSGRCSRPTYRGRAERLPAGEHRQLRDHVHLHHVHPGVSFAGCSRLARAQDLLHDRGGLRLPLPLPLRAGSFDIELGNLSDNPVSVAIILVGGVLLLVAVARMFWKRVHGIWERAKDGAEILRHPWVYFTRVFFVEFLGWSAKLAVIGIFLASPSVSGRCSAVPAQHSICRHFSWTRLVRQAVPRYCGGARWCCPRQQKSPISGDFLSRKAL